jgi:cytochrome c biogenesis protein CcmG/thiol:disulfide interchange protein DsbE
MRLIAFVPLAALAVLIAVGAFLLTREGDRERFTAGMVGRPAPNYALARLDGGAPLTSQQMRGRTYVINLFASWCTPCRAEHAQLMAMKQRGVEIVGIAYKDRREASVAFLAELGDPFSAVVTDPEGRFALELGITGVPETFVIGPDGVIRAAYRGPLTDDTVRDLILPAVSEP